jgi:hypothetical protein
MLFSGEETTPTFRYMGSLARAAGVHSAARDDAAISVIYGMKRQLPTDLHIQYMRYTSAIKEGSTPRCLEGYHTAWWPFQLA